jgi:hypothetical protein
MKSTLLTILVVLTVLASSATAADRISGDNNVGCKSRDYYKKLLQYAAQGDMQAFNQGLTGGILAGTCIWFKAGEPVFITDTSMFLIKVRRQGSTAEYWTNMEAVK